MISHATDHEIDKILEELTSPSSSHRVHMAVELAATPLRDERVLEALEALLDDTTPTVIHIPITIGQVRWVIAHAASATRGALGHPPQLVISDITLPIRDREVMSLAEARWGHEALRWGLFGMYERVRTEGLLPTGELRLPRT